MYKTPQVWVLNFGTKRCVLYTGGYGIFCPCSQKQTVKSWSADLCFRSSNRGHYTFQLGSPSLKQEWVMDLRHTKLAQGDRHVGSMQFSAVEEARARLPLRASLNAPTHSEDVHELLVTLQMTTTSRAG